MKELSIEEKAKAYDEVIERANSLLSGNELGNAWIYKLLPGLRESEDEKIRKALISILKSDFEKDTTIYDISVGNIIAWLEKQGEQKSAWSEEDERIYKSIIYSFAHNYPLTVQQQEFVKSLIPQINITDEELAQAKKDAYNDALDKIEYHSGKPTFDDGWSAAIWYLKKRNAQPQNRWKESLATANLENSLCDMQDGFSDTSYEYRILGEAIEFIRCTESKPQWKPNDEQMQFLLKYAEQNNYDGSILISLYKDLKKLRGE